MPTILNLNSPEALLMILGLVNVIFFIGFIYLIFKATKLVREKWGLIAAIIFVIGCLSFVGKSGDSKEGTSSNVQNSWHSLSKDTLATNGTLMKTFKLDSSLFSSYQMTIFYGKHKSENTNIPVSAYTFTNGFVGVNRWLPMTITLERTADNNKFSYNLSGIIEWKIFGAIVFSEPKDYQGFVVLP